MPRFSHIRLLIGAGQTCRYGGKMLPTPISRALCETRHWERRGWHAHSRPTDYGRAPTPDAAAQAWSARPQKVGPSPRSLQSGQITETFCR